MSNKTINIEWDNFSEQSLERNLGLKVKDTIFWVSRRGLADLSPIFKTMLYGDFKESKQEIVKLSDKEPEEILELLRCLFPCNQNGQRMSIDEENVGMLLRLGDEYEITDLLYRCRQYIMVKIQKSSFKIAKFLNLAAQYKMKAIVRAGLRRLSEFKSGELLADQSFTTASLNIRYAVLMIQAFRDSRSTDHNFKSCYFEECPNGSCRVTGHKCTVCGLKGCYCYFCDPKCPRACDVEKCPICHVCKCKYGETEFVCKCIDAKIETELVKLGL